MVLYIIIYIYIYTRRKGLWDIFPRVLGNHRLFDYIALDLTFVPPLTSDTEARKFYYFNWI